MATLIEAVLDAQTGEPKKEAGFPHAPDGWTKTSALKVAEQDRLKLHDDHWQLVQAIQEYFAKNTERPINLRKLHDALDERFHPQGGIRYLYQILPGGPIAQGCRLAGIEVPAGAVDRSFGSTA
jgi:tRNA 2-thiouridine synthesizing protein E